MSAISQDERLKAGKTTIQVNRSGPRTRVSFVDSRGREVVTYDDEVVRLVETIRDGSGEVQPIKRVESKGLTDVNTGKPRLPKGWESKMIDFRLPPGFRYG
ncbi:hypothetical protein [Magnetospira sp. QH-2]|uniref:hypothetical protein n=1 Tax=Magnetospira sp. (strain QH-2) TaxID=1288970 RepID=UPI0003E8188A|nr:hypothetical protein [Magnetospira sp. QH-2]CCQ73927.1 Protein of unknown function [Magnetospira sp. QH-2]